MSINTLITHNNEKLPEIDDPYIIKAMKLQTSENMLTIKDFISLSGFPIDKFMVDNFFDNLNDDIPIYVTNDLIEWCGFKSKEFKNKKRDFNIVMDNFEEGNDYWSYSNQDYTTYYNESMLRNLSIGISEKSISYPNPSTFIGKNKTKHIILTVQCFKLVLMMLNTPKAHEIRLYYLALEKLIKTYAKYQYQYQFSQVAIRNDRIDTLIKKLGEQNKTLDKQNELLTDLKEDNKELLKDTKKMLKKIDISTDDRVPKSSAGKQEHFILLKLNREGHEWHYHVVRVQNRSVNRTLKNKRIDFPNMEILVNITYQPNAKNLFDRVQEYLVKQSKIKRRGNCISLNGAFTEESFIQKINDINDDKKILPVVETDDESDGD